MTHLEMKDHQKKIDQLDQVECARLFRFAEVGHPYFTGELYNYFKQHFTKLGGMTPEISKQIGWGE